MDDLLHEFIAETRETLEAIAGEIVAWEANPGDAARLDAIFRFVHTVKGSCGFLDLPHLVRLSHAAEDALAAVREGRRTADTALVDAVLAVVDRIGVIVEALAIGTPVDQTGDAALINALEPGAALAPIAASVKVNAKPERSIRLSVDLLDRMMNGMSDLVLARNELARQVRETGEAPRVEAALARLSQTLGDMRDAVARARMQKIDALFAPLPRMVRDIAAAEGKQVALTTEGGDVELDREMIELLRDPITHIVRNAIDHGIESPESRRKAGKGERGRLHFAARQGGNQIFVEISDDGRGIDVERVARRAVALGIITESALAAMSEDAKQQLVFAPGLSSRDAVSELSGRGVGMDVVRVNIEQLGGRIAMVNAPGRGLTITIQVPLTLSIIAALVVCVGEQRFALPREAVEEIVTTKRGDVDIAEVGGARVAMIRGERLPLVDLADLFGMTDQPPAEMLAIIGTRQGRYALAVHSVVDTEELVIKPAAPAVMASGCYAGQSLPDNGLPMLLLDGTGVAKAAGLTFAPYLLTSADEVPLVQEPGRPALLFIDSDGQRRAVALAAVDRIELVDAAQLRVTGGVLRLVSDGALVPAHALALPATAKATVLRFTDGGTGCAYVIREALDIATLPAAMARVAAPGPILGVALVDGEPVEVIDPYWLIGGAGSADARPLCLLHADAAGWMESFLQPALEAAGYRCTTRLTSGESAAVALAMDDAAVAPDPSLIRLQRQPGEGPGIYRYDRARLIAAVAERVGAAR